VVNVDFYFFRLCFTLLDIVWGNGNSESTWNLSCSTDRNCIFENVHIMKFGEIEPRIIHDLKTAKTLIFQNSRFEYFPKGIAKHFIALIELRATDCEMPTLDNNFVSYSNSSQNNHLPKLDKVDFSRNQLLKVEALARLPNLRHLNLSSNLIGELQKGSFTGLGQLQVLDLGSNKITKIAPHTFSTVPSLDIVILANNQLTQLPENVFSAQKRLIEIDMAHNNLTTFDFGAIGSTWKLERINLAQNHMTSLQNLTTRPKEQTNITTINVTDYKWNCSYAQQLEIQAYNYNFELIGINLNSTMFVLDLKNSIKNFEERLDSNLDKCTNTTKELQKQIGDQNKTITLLRMNFENKTEELKLMETKLNQTIEEHLNCKMANINPWIMIVILTATTILTVIVGVFATLFVKNRRTQYKFDAIKHSLQE
jgi:Leucine rich repeat